MEPKYPDIHVRLSGEDGNALFIVGRTAKALRRAGIPNDEIEAFSSEALSGDYHHVLQTVMRTVSTE